jgi:xylulokinase
MSVILSAASCLTWITAVTAAGSEAALLAEIEAADREPGVVFLPYLSGERTPHNDPHARGVFFGLRHDTTRADLGRAVLEGVAFALADGQDALRAGDTAIDEVSVIGGGARSSYWGRILATVLDRPLPIARGDSPRFRRRARRLAWARGSLLPLAPALGLPSNLTWALRDRYRQRLALYRDLCQSPTNSWERGTR